MGFSNLFQKQPIMRRVCFAITPLFIYSILLYGMRPVYQLAVAFIVGIITEYIFEKKRGKKVSEAVLVTCYLYGLSMPPAIPIWMNIVGIVFAVFIAKCVFGGFGRNLYNPAMSGRLFAYLAFPVAFTTLYWVDISPLMQNFAQALGSSYTPQAADAVSSATPLMKLRNGEVPLLLNLFFGLRNGSLGEGAVFLTLIAAFYLIFTKTADWRLMVPTIVISAILYAGFYALGWMPGFKENLSTSEGVRVVLAYLMSGGLLFVAVFMATDPVSAPNNPLAKWIYGFIIGLSTALIRLFSGFPEGVSFALLLANAFACLLDEITPKKAPVKKSAPANAAAAPQKK